MIRKFAVLAADGITIEAAGMAPEVPDGAIELPKEFDLGLVSRSYVVGGALVPRPPGPALALSGEGFVIADCPEGTRITIADLIAEGGEVVAVVEIDAASPDFSFAFDDPGRYQIEIAPPFPFLSSRYEVTK